MEKIKIIDLLNKIANEQIKEDSNVISIEKVMPKKIKWGKHFFKWHICEYKEENGEATLYNYLVICPHMLNDEVETLEEDKKIEKISEDRIDSRYMTPDEIELTKKINEIIDKINGDS